MKFSSCSAGVINFMKLHEIILESENVLSVVFKV